MGVVTGTGENTKGRAKLGLWKKVASGVAVGALTLSLAACSSSGTKALGTVTLQKALDDYHAGNTTLAQTEFKQLVKQDPSNKFGWYNLGVLAQYAGNTSEAGSDYKKAIAIDGNFESALYNYGVLRLTSGDLNNAIIYLERAVAQKANDANAHWNLGLALAKRNGGKDDNARSTKELNAGLKLNPALIKSLGSPSSSAATTTTAATP